MASKQGKHRGIIRRLLPYYSPYMFVFVTDILAVIVLAGMNLALPYLLKVFVDTVIPAKDVEGLIHIVLLAGAIVLVKLGANYYTLYAGHMMAIKMERDMRRDLFYHLQKLSFNFYDDRKTGEIMSRMTNDIGRVADSVNHAPEDIFLSFISIAGSFAVLSSLHWQLALICFIPLPLMFLYSSLYGTRMLRGFRRINDSIADINAQVENSIAGIRVVKSFAREDFEKKNFDTLNHRFFLSWKGAMRSLAGFFSGINGLRDLSNLIILLAGGYFIFNGKMTIGTLAAFLFYVAIYLEPVERLSRTNEMIQKMIAGLVKFFEILDTDPEIQDRKHAEAIRSLQGKIEFRNVTFQYNNNKQIFTDLNLVIPPGRTIALVGPSGAGKTTFCSLIPRFYDVTAGAVEIDGTNVADISLRSLRENVGIVQQDVFLFTGTIRENIAYGKIDAEDESIVAAAKKANAHEFILGLPDGYDTNIGEKGVKLSGGQKQRISIARVFLKNPGILILDEATSSLDTRSEIIIQSAISKLIKGRTTLIIAHRLSTIKDADEIIVLSEEGIEQRGTHEELMRTPGLYADLYTAHIDDGIITDEDLVKAE